jgi:hypothetical protein
LIDEMMQRLFALAVLATLGFAAQAAAQAQGPVVELYTSQGCSSCPPADALLGELAGRDDVIALSFHVDYWDYIGWKDTFALPANGERQKGYAEALKARRVYTPQMVIDGAAMEVGSNREGVLTELARARSRPRLDVSLTHEGDHVVLKLPAGAANGDAAIWLVRYDSARPVEIERGENRGRSVTYRNVVVETSSLGVWSGAPVEVTLSEAQLVRGGGGGCAVIVQEGLYGRVLGAARLDLASIN